MHTQLKPQQRTTELASLEYLCQLVEQPDSSRNLVEEHITEPLPTVFPYYAAAG